MLKSETSEAAFPDLFSFTFSLTTITIIMSGQSNSLCAKPCCRLQAEDQATGRATLRFHDASSEAYDTRLDTLLDLGHDTRAILYLGHDRDLIHVRD